MCRRKEKKKMITKKDIANLANIFHQVKDQSNKDTGDDSKAVAMLETGYQLAVGVIQAHVSQYLATANTKFNLELFNMACDGVKPIKLKKVKPPAFL